METPRPDAARALSLDELLAHRGFLHALVRGILADEQGVEDVLQETWLKALERPPGKVESLRGWLGQVARNTALNRLRRDRRGAERERRAGRPEGDDASALDTVQKLERQQRVLAAVLGLREPWRTTIHLRYFENKAPAEIARTLGVSVNTVNDRLQRGRRDLRRELEAYGAGSGALGLYLLPLAGLSKGASAALESQFLALGSVAAGTGTTLAQGVLGGLLMSKKLLVVVAVALCATGLWLAKDEPRAAVAEAPVGSAAPLERTRSIPLVPSETLTPAAAPSPSAAGAERAGVAGSTEVRGLVLDGDERPVPGVALRARLWSGYVAADAADVEAELRSDDEGRFTWLAERPDGAFVVQIAPADERYTGYGDEALVLAGATARPLEVTVHGFDVTVRGFVRDLEGRPLVGATVRGTESVQTDQDGAYVLRSSSQALGQFTASAPGFAAKRETMGELPPGEARLDFALRSEFRIHGRITDEAGLPVAGVRVTTFFANGTFATSDAHGQYDLGGLDPGRERHSLFARKSGYVEAEAVVAAAPEGAEQDLVMRVGTRVSGRVLDEEGRPLAGARLYIGFSPDAYDRLDTVAVDDGSFVFSSVKSGEQTLGTHREGFAPDRRTFQVDEDQQQIGDLAIVLRRGRVARGHVFDGDSRPVPGVLVHARYQGEWIETRVHTDEEGSFELPDLPPTEIVLHFYRSGWVRLRQPLADGGLGEEPQEILLTRAGGLAGRAIDAATGRPLVSFTVRLLPPECPDGQEAYAGGVSASWMREGHSFSSADGTWESGDENLTPGSFYRVEITADGYAPASDPCVQVVTDPDPAAHTLALSAGCSVEGIVLDRATGAPLSDALVRRSRVRVINPDEPHDVQLTRTGPDGRFVLHDVSPGRTTLIVEHANWRKEFLDGPFDVSADGLTPFREIAIGGGASLTGVLRDREGRPAADVEVALFGEAREIIGDLELTVRTDADGRFAFRELSDGVYTIGPSPGDGRAADFRMVVFVKEGRSHELELPAARGSASLVGTAESADPLPGLPVWAMRLPPSFPDIDEPLPQWSGILHDGAFRIDGLPAGTYLLLVQHREEGSGANYSGRTQVEVAAGAEVQVSLPIAAR